MVMTYATVGTGEFTANNLTNSQQSDVQVTALSGGRFLTTWTTNDTTQDGSWTAIKGRIFNSDGSAAGGGEHQPDNENLNAAPTVEIV